jgi:hypothetical protein
MMQQLITQQKKPSHHIEYDLSLECQIFEIVPFQLTEIYK